MLTKREWIAFAAGAAAFHTLGHIIMAFVGLPITIMSITLTQQLNALAIIVSAAITVALLWWLSKLKA
jgi:hypothetical protein